MLSNMTIGKRLGLGFAVILAISVAMSVMSIWRLQVAADTTRKMMQQPLAKERMVSDWTRNIYAAVRRTTAIAKSSDTTLGQFFSADQKEASKSSSELKAAVEPLLTSEKEQALYKKITATRERYNHARDTVIKLKGTGDSDQAATIFEQQYLPASVEYQQLMQELLTLQRSEIDHLASEIDAMSARSANILMALAAVLVLVGTVYAWRLTVGIVAPLKDAVGAAHRVASGDLTAPIHASGNDEISQLLAALNDMRNALQGVVGGIRASTDTITTASHEIASGNADLSARTELQATSLESTARAMNDLTATVRKNADNAGEANRLAVSASGSAGKGGEVVAEVVNNMSAIKASSDKIVDIISVIDGIAFQTNILALNAAVEAARAGEQGRGFAVVASEVRTLAQRSAAAAKEIKELISGSVEQVEAGNRLVGEAGKTMAEIVGEVRQLAALMQEITEAGMAQSQGIEQVNRSVGEMEQMTQQNAALVEQAAAAAASMKDQADVLAQTVSVFKLGGDAHHAHHAMHGSHAAGKALAKPRPALKRVRA